MHRFRFPYEAIRNQNRNSEPRTEFRLIVLFGKKFFKPKREVEYIVLIGIKNWEVNEYLPHLL